MMNESDSEIENSEISEDKRTGRNETQYNTKPAIPELISMRKEYNYRKGWFFLVQYTS